MPKFEVTTTELVTRRYVVRARGVWDAHMKVDEMRNGYDVDVEIFPGDEEVVRAVEIEDEEVKG